MDMPDPYSLGDAWGVGWILFDWDGHRLIGHDGNTIGQASFLRILPEEGLAVTLLTNGGNTHDLYVELFGEIFHELAGAGGCRPASTLARGARSRYDFSEVRGRLRPLGRGAPRSSATTMASAHAQSTLNGPLAAMLPDPVQEHPLVPRARGEFVMRPEGEQAWHAVVFYSLPSGERYLHHGVRAARSVS